jgi:hypothetical protein
VWKFAWFPTPTSRVWGGSGLFHGRDRFYLYKTVWYRNRWQAACAWGSIRPSDDGTELDFRIGLPRFMPTMTAIELGLWTVVVIGIAWFLGPASLLRIIETPLFAIALFAVPVSVIGASLAGRRAARTEPTFLHNFLATTLLTEHQKVRARTFGRGTILP